MPFPCKSECRIRGSIRLSGSRAGGRRRGRPRLEAHPPVPRPRLRRPLAPLQFVGMDTPNTAITLTDGAAAKVKELLASQEDASDQALRVAVRGGGCSGFQYALAFDKRRDDDHVFEQNGVSVVVIAPLVERQRVLAPGAAAAANRDAERLVRGVLLRREQLLDLRLCPVGKGYRRVAGIPVSY